MRAPTLALTLALTGCQELLAEEAPSEQERPPAAPAEVAPDDPGASEPSGESIDDCLVRVREQTPRSVRETIDAIGYDMLLLDSCRARAAEEQRSVEICAQIEARLVRRACESRVAIASRNPTACPSTPSGREPLCLALASRDRALCAAAPYLEREACAELLGEEGACGGSIAPELCEAVVGRHTGRLGTLEAGAVEDTQALERELRVTFTRVHDGESTPVGLPAQRLASFDRGARLLDDAGRTVLELADPLGLSVVSLAGQPSMRVLLPLPTDESAADARVEARVGPLAASVELSHPTLGHLRASEGRIELTQLSRELGGLVEGRLSVSCPSPPGVIRVEARFRTFVRDVAVPQAPGGPRDTLEGLAEP